MISKWLAGAVFKLDRTRTLDLASAEAKPWTEFKKEAQALVAMLETLPEGDA